MINIDYLLHDIKQKIISYEMFAEKRELFSDAYTRALFLEIDFEPIFGSINLADKDQAIATVSNLIQRFEVVRLNDTLVSEISKYDGTCLEFSTIEKCIDERRDHLIEIESKLKDVLKVLQKGQECSTTLENNNVANPPQKQFIPSTAFVKNLASLELNDILVWGENLDEKILVDQLLLFVMGNFSKMNYPLNVSCKTVEVGYFLIHQIFGNIGLDLSSIKNLTLNGKEFKPANCSKSVSVLKKKLENGQCNAQTLESIKVIENLFKPPKR
jgi:hypothetical protein